MTDRVCFCGDLEREHGEDTGECLYCECEGFSEDVEATIELEQEQHDPEEGPF
jgi:hypothetical protein